MSASLNTAQQYLDKGLSFYNKGWLDEAINSYRIGHRDAQRKFSAGILPTRSRASGCRRRRRRDRGAAFIDRAATRQPRRLLLARPHAARRGEYPEAIGAYRKAIEQRSGNHPWAYHNLGIALLRRGDFGEAVDAFNSAIEQRHGDFPKAWHNLGVAFARRGDLEQAAGAFRKALEQRHGNYPDTNSSLARVLGREGRPARRGRVYTRGDRAAALAFSASSLRVEPSAFRIRTARRSDNRSSRCSGEPAGLSRSALCTRTRSCSKGRSERRDRVLSHGHRPARAFPVGLSRSGCGARSIGHLDEAVDAYQKGDRAESAVPARALRSGQCVIQPWPRVGSYRRIQRGHCAARRKLPGRAL